VRDFDDAGEDPWHDTHIFGVAAACGFEASGNAGTFVLGALGEGSMGASMAFETRHMMMQGDAIADLKSADTNAAANDYACGFVSKNARRWDCAILDLFDVGGADAADGDLDQQLLGADARDRNDFEAEIVWAAIDDRAHGSWDGKH
jgi:hypothetical protein